MPYDSAVTDTPRGPSYWFLKVSPNAGLIYQKYGHELSVKLLTLAQILESSTLREMRGIVHMTLVHLPQWEGKYIDIDMFANADNSLCPQYVSRLADIGSTPSCIDAFFQPHWRGYRFLRVSPRRRRLPGSGPYSATAGRTWLAYSPFMGTT